MDFYTPHNWYWKADDGRVYSSETETVSTGGDVPGMTSIWPRDVEGNQTDAELQDVLLPYGKFVNLTYYTAAVRDKTLGAGITVNGRPFATDPITTMSLNSAYIYTQSKTAETFSWKLPDGSYVELNKAEIQALQGAVAQYGQDCFACEADVVADIGAGIVITRAQVDAAFAAVSNNFTGTAVEDVKFKKWQRRKT